MTQIKLFRSGDGYYPHFVEISTFRRNIHVPWILSEFLDISIFCGYYPHFMEISVFCRYYPYFVEISTFHGYFWFLVDLSTLR